MLLRQHGISNIYPCNVIYTWYTNVRLLNPYHGNKRRVSGIKGGHALCKALVSTSWRPNFKRARKVSHLLMMTDTFWPAPLDASLLLFPALGLLSFCPRCPGVLILAPSGLNIETASLTPRCEGNQRAFVV
jgi:hypothetical protein